VDSGMSRVNSNLDYQAVPVCSFVYKKLSSSESLSFFFVKIVKDHS